MRRVEIERDTPTRRWRVWVIDELGGQLRVMAADGAWIDLDRKDPTDLPDPTWIIDDEVWIPLTAAMLGLPTDQRPVADHLTDAREVRDRLLALVEMGFERAVTGPPRLLTAAEAEAQR